MEKQTDNNEHKDIGETGKKFKINGHIIIIAVIVLIAGTAVFRLMKWNKGTASDYDPDYVTTDFDVEPLDMIIPMEESRLEGRDSEGKPRILCIGNNPFSDETGKDGLASMIKEKTGAQEVYNIAFPDSAIGCKYAMYNPEYREDLFNLYYVTQSLITGEFMNAIESVAVDKDNPAFMKSVEIMKEVDLDKIDMVVIMYDTTDYNILTPSDNPDNQFDVTSYTGALRLALKNLQEAYPHLRIFLMSHSYAQYKDENGKLSSGNITDMGHGDLPHYLVMQADVALDQGISFIDNYFGTINEDNYKEYMKDYMHYNKKGRELLADRISDIIVNRSGTVTVNQ